jgi:hypothetical protein
MRGERPTEGCGAWGRGRRRTLSLKVLGEDGELDPATPVVGVADPLDVRTRRLTQDRLRVLLLIREHRIRHDASQPVRTLPSARAALKRMRDGSKEARVVGGDDAADELALLLGRGCRHRRTTEAHRHGHLQLCILLHQRRRLTGCRSALAEAHRHGHPQIRLLVRVCRL